MRNEGLAHWNEDIGISPSLGRRDGNISIQAVDDGPNQSANIQRSGGGSDGVCERRTTLRLPVSKR